MTGHDPGDTVPTASIVITNYNYERFVRFAIDSALAQSHPDCEVVVVDDGSSDGSRAMIESYRDQVHAVYKRNGGQASAFNAGFDVSRGDIVCFLDADDVLEPTAIEAAGAALAAPGTTQVQWPLWHLDADGRRSGKLYQGGALPEGDIAEEVLRHGPVSHGFSPTSGNAFTRAFLERVLPMPEQDFRVAADTYLAALAPMYGRLARIDEPQAAYRQHGAGAHVGASFEATVRKHLGVIERVWDVAIEHAAALGLEPDRTCWPEYSWWHRLARLLDDVSPVIGQSDDFVLIDDDLLGLTWRCARAHPFLERNGMYWGPPPDDATAVAELRRMRDAGARYAVVVWPSFWWLDHYPALKAELAAAATPLLEDERVKVFGFESGAPA
jgi:glycosyltransferase involved in cell wall biosynthesis